MKILMSGGTGLIGKELGKKLTHKGHKLFVLTRDPDRSLVKTPYPHTPVFWDATKTSIDKDILSQIDGIIHLAGAGISDQRWNQNYKNKIFNSRVIGTQNLVRQANEFCSNIQFFISNSAIGYYGEGEDLSEDAHPGSYFLSKVCTAWESPIDNHLHEDIRSVVLRVGVVLSDKGGALEKMASPIQMGIGGPLGSGQQLVSWIDIEDLTNIYLHSIESSITGTFNAVAPQPVSNLEMTQEIAKIFAKKASFKVPSFALKAAVGGMSEVLLMSQGVSAKKIMDSGFTFQFPDIESSIKKRVTKLESPEKKVIFEQWVPKKKEDIFPFFSDAKNLEKITPPWLHFKILSQSTESIEKETNFEYQIKINGIPVKWKTIIDQWNPPHSFSDSQEKGPYSKWHHHHFFEDLAEGTLMTDQVQYIMHVGHIGSAILGWKINEDVQNIFDYRQLFIHNYYKEK